MFDTMVKDMSKVIYECRSNGVIGKCSLTGKTTKLVETTLQYQVIKTIGKNTLLSRFDEIT